MMQPNLGGLVTYLSAPPARRSTEARKLADQSEADYAVETDFWKRMREAIVRDRKTTRDGRALLAAAAAASEKKQVSFKAVADAWPALATRWAQTTYRNPHTTLTTLGGLTVAVRPLFVEQDADGNLESVAVWMNVPEPSESAVLGALRFMTLAEPTSVATFIDVRRGRVWSVSETELSGVDGWLERQCSQLVGDAA